MVRTYVRKTQPYDKEAMELAIKAVQSGDMGYKKAARTFQVKRETLRDHVLKRYKKLGAGRNTLLTAEEEAELAECLKVMARWGFGYTRQETRELTAEYLQAKERAEPGYIPGEDWLSGFISRNTSLTSRKPEQLKSARAKCIANKDIISSWFQLLKETFERHNLTHRPDLIYNVDESGFPMDPSRIKVFCEKNISHLFRVIGGSGRDSITVNGCCNALGQILPPYIVYPGKNLWDVWTKDGPQGARFNVSEKGWMDSVCFLDWFENHFLKNITSERPVVLIFDGHASHMNLNLLKKAKENQVLLLKLPSNSTNILQPLDVGLYGPAKTEWEKILIKFARTNLGAALTKERFPMILKQLWESEAMSARNAQAGFKKCGVFPLNADAISQSMYESANLFDKVDPSQWVFPVYVPARDSTEALTNNTAEPSSTPTVAAEPSSTPTAAAEPSSTPTVAAEPSSTPTVAAEPSTSTSTEQSSAAAPKPHTESASTSTEETPPRFPLSPKKTATNESIKDFFMKRISPLIAKKSDSGKRRCVKRMYGESLTEGEIVERLEEAEVSKRKQQKTRQIKGRGKGKNTPVSVTDNIENQKSDSDNHESDIDDDNDHDWIPPKALQSQRNVFDLTF